MQLSQMHFHLEHFHPLNSSIILLSSLIWLYFSTLPQFPPIITPSSACLWLSISFISDASCCCCPSVGLIGSPSLWYPLARWKWPNPPLSLQLPGYCLHHLIVNLGCVKRLSFSVHHSGAFTTQKRWGYISLLLCNRNHLKASNEDKKPSREASV